MSHTTGSSSNRQNAHKRQRAVKSKKSFDQQKVDDLVEGRATLYRGQLDPRRKKGQANPRAARRAGGGREDGARPASVSGRAGKDEGFSDFRDRFGKCQASPGRLAALYATRQVRCREAYAQEVIESTIDRSRLSAQDRAFATLLTLGVVSARGALDAVIDRALANPRDVKPDVRDALRISTYEIVYLRKAPHAAVDQGVELVRAVSASAAGLGNAVLHRILALAESFPFGDPATDIDALALSLAFPAWLARMLIEDMGAPDAIELMRASNEPAPLFLAVNANTADDGEVTDLFSEMGSPLVPCCAGGVEPRGCYRLDSPRVLADGRVRRLFQQGKILVSDAAAQAVAACVLEDGLPETLLEVGAGRGTKTILLQSGAYRRFDRQIALTAIDVHAFKGELLRKRAADYGIELKDVVTGNASRLDSVMPGRMFDSVFIDAPCSGLGTLRRHQDIRWRLLPDHIDELADTSLSLLKSAAQHVNAGGSIVYSTCTVTYAENNGVVKRFLESEEGCSFALAPVFGRSCFSSKLAEGSPDAHFAVKFVRKL